MCYVPHFELALLAVLANYTSFSSTWELIARYVVPTAPYDWSVELFVPIVVRLCVQIASNLVCPSLIFLLYILAS